MFEPDSRFNKQHSVLGVQEARFMIRSARNDNIPKATAETNAYTGRRARKISMISVDDEARPFVQSLRLRRTERPAHYRRLFGSIFPNHSQFSSLYATLDKRVELIHHARSDH